MTFPVFIQKINTCKKLVPVLDTGLWPSPKELEIDRSQYIALQTAITKELAIIQGPPGTGKTFIGLKIVQLLLANSHVWRSDSLKSPILIVCYTNHALDQFLEGIMGCTEGIQMLRVGGRCKNNAVEPFILKNIKQIRRDSKKRTYSVMQNERECLYTVKTNERQIMDISSKLSKTSTQLVSVEMLKCVMSENHTESFERKESLTKLSIANFLECHDYNDDDNTDTNAIIRKEWESFILNEVVKMAQNEISMVFDVWALGLQKRAELYKAWQSECLQNISKFKLIEPSAKKCSDTILTLENLTKCLKKASSQFHLKTLRSHPIAHQVASAKLVAAWLCISDKGDTYEIKGIIDSYTEQNEIETMQEVDVINDIEEERQILDDDDYFIHDGRKTLDKDIQTKTKDDSQWVENRNQKKMAVQVKNLLQNVDPFSEDEMNNIKNIWSLDNYARRRVYMYWLQKYRIKLREDVKQAETMFNSAAYRLQEVRDQETVEIMRECSVMGMTTTGAAKFRKLLQKVNPQIIIVEEAAEVLESHIVTTLNDKCKHLILIGDHKQLRPSTSVYELSKKFEMDVSMFERLVNNGLPCVTLEEQHRMRPEISEILKRESLYLNLRDHASVLRYEHVRGVDTDFQFISHSEPEVDSKESTSYSNLHEAKYIAELTRYFLNQGYASDQIAVLTHYIGQVFLLRKQMPKPLFEGVRITAVDNFQGEENDIILLSLVRSSENSSKRNPIGFVGTQNRICVSLSRAKIGLYVFGNFALIESCSHMWADIISDMKEKDRVKDSLRLRCSNHPD